MRVIQAQSAGFCYGVERAVRMAEEAAAAGGCVMLGSIIHNDSVVRRLEALGARQVQSAEEVQPGETVLIRAHAEPVENIRPLAEKNRAKVLEILEVVRELCREPKMFEEVLQGVFAHYRLTMDFNQYVLVGSTIRSYLAYLLDRGSLTAAFDDNRLLWQSV